MREECAESRLNDGANRWSRLFLGGHPRGNLGASCDLLERVAAFLGAPPRTAKGHWEYGAG